MATPTLPRNRRTRERLAKRLLPDELSASCARLDALAAGDEKLQKEVAMLVLRAYKLGLRDGSTAK
jgi:hypothetical protein